MFVCVCGGIMDHEQACIFLFVGFNWHGGWVGFEVEMFHSQLPTFPCCSVFFVPEIRTKIRTEHLSKGKKRVFLPSQFPNLFFCYFVTDCTFPWGRKHLFCIIFVPEYFFPVNSIWRDIFLSLVLYLHTSMQHIQDPDREGKCNIHAANYHFHYKFS